MILNVICFGHPMPMRVTKDRPLKHMVKAAIKKSRNDPKREWELRDAVGSLLDTESGPEEQGLEDKARVFLSPKVGSGG